MSQSVAQPPIQYFLPFLLGLLTILDDSSLTFSKFSDRFWQIEMGLLFLLISLIFSSSLFSSHFRVEADYPSANFGGKRPKLEECIFCRRWISGTLSSWLMLFCVTLLPYTSYCGARLDYERSEKWGEMGKCLRELAREYRKWEGERDERAEERGRVKAGTVRMKNSAKRGGKGKRGFPAVGEQM